MSCWETVNAYSVFRSGHDLAHDTNWQLCKGSSSVSSFLSLTATSEISALASNIILFLRFVLFIYKHFHLEATCIIIHWSVLQESLDNFDHLVLIYFLFPELKQTLELWISWVLHQLFGIHSSLVLGQQKAIQICCRMKTYL